MNPKIRALEAIAAAYEDSFRLDDEQTFTEAVALREGYTALEELEYEDLLQHSKSLLLTNWRVSRRACLSTFMHFGIFSTLLEYESIICHLWSIRNDQDRHTIEEIKSAVLDRILEAVQFELEDFMDEFEFNELDEEKKTAFLNCSPQETVLTVIDLCGMLKELDADLSGTPIDLLVQEREDD